MEKLENETAEARKSMMEKLDQLFANQVDYELTDKVNRSERVFALMLFIGNLLLLIYFAAHQIMATGFYTAAFGIVEMIMLYGSCLFWMITSALEGIFERKNASRLFDLYFGPSFLVTSLIWLLVIFPFDFSHFAAALPYSLEFLLQWISNIIAQVILILVIIIAVVGLIYSALLRVAVRRARASIAQRV